LNEPATTDLRIYLRPLVERAWLIILVVVLVTAATYAYFESRPKDYTATTTMLARTSPLEAALLGEQVTQPNANELAVLATSRATAQAVDRRLRGRGVDGNVSAAAVENPGGNPATLVRLTATASRPADAALLGNTYATTFASLSSARTKQQVRRTREQYEAELATLTENDADPSRRRHLTREIRRLGEIEQLPAATIEQVDAATPPAEATGTSPERNALFGFSVSLLLAVGAAYLLAWLDNRVRRSEELEDLYGLRMLGSIPHVRQPAPADAGQLSLSPQLRDPLRGIRVNLELMHEGPLRTILVTSATAEEGRTTVVRNLALAYREAGQRAAVIEADLRDPQLAELFLVSRAPGLAEVLTGDEPLTEAIQQAGGSGEALISGRAGGNGVPAGGAETGGGGGGGIAVLTGGAASQVRTDLVSPRVMAPVLEEVAARYDVVIVDSPPVLPLSDSVQLLSAVDGVVVVARLGNVTRDEAREVSEILSRVKDVRALGVIANDVPVRSLWTPWSR
jgi:polysaccharide biosynthesis transport protein